MWSFRAALIISTWLYGILTASIDGRHGTGCMLCGFPPCPKLKYIQKVLDDALSSETDTTELKTLLENWKIMDSVRQKIKDALTSGENLNEKDGNSRYKEAMADLKKEIGEALMGYDCPP